MKKVFLLLAVAGFMLAACNSNSSKAKTEEGTEGVMNAMEHKECCHKQEGKPCDSTCMHSKECCHKEGKACDGKMKEECHKHKGEKHHHEGENLKQEVTDAVKEAAAEVKK